MTSAVDELWAVARSGAQVDAAALARAVEEATEGALDPLDYRTRLLIRDSLTALQSHWGRDEFRAWRRKAVQRARERSG